jgi:hypothetical protein
MARRCHDGIVMIESAVGANLSCQPVDRWGRRCRSGWQLAARLFADCFRRFAQQQHKA